MDESPDDADGADGRRTAPDESPRDAPDGADGGPDDPAATGGDPSFAAELDRARALLTAEDLTAFAVGAVRDGRAVETTFSYLPDAVDADREGIQALTLLAAHVRVVADEAGVDPLTAATDAAALAGRVEEVGTGAAGGEDGADDGADERD